MWKSGVKKTRPDASELLTTLIDGVGTDREPPVDNPAPLD
jgi:hypothetical protein